MLKLVRLALAGLLIQASMTAVFAQQGGGGRGPGGGFGGFGSMNRLMSTSTLVTQKSVQDELKLTDDQLAKVKEAGEKVRASFGGGGGFGGGGNNNRTEAEIAEARKKAEETRKANDKLFTDILTADQAKRVKEIALQKAGPMILASHEDTQKAVGLTDDQKTKIKEISDNLNDESRKLFPAGGFGGGRDNNRTDAEREEARKKAEENREKAQTLNKAAVEKVVAVLTPEQKKTWEGLVGKKFDGEINPFGGFGGGGRGRGQGGGGNRPANN